MNEAHSIDVWEVLYGFGFVPDATGEMISVRKLVLSFSFVDLKLHASCVMSPISFSEVVLFSGVWATPRMLALVEFEMPCRVSSPEQCAAWIAGNLDQHAPNKLSTASFAVDWLAEGRKHENLLPWRLELEAYLARPRCMVQREWWRLASKSLVDLVSNSPDDASVVFGFDGTVLTIRCVGKVIALSGEGKQWSKRYSIPARMLRKLQKRFMRAELEISIWESRLHIGSWVYGGVTEAGDMAEIDLVRND